MKTVVCPKCKTRVFPKADGTCPSCQLPINAKKRAQPAGKAPRKPVHNKPPQSGTLQGSRFKKTVCPDCGMNVVPKPDDTCPSCGYDFDSGESSLSEFLPEDSLLQRERKPARRLPTIKSREIHFGDIFSGAARIIGNHKVLWILASIQSLVSTLYVGLLFFWMGGSLSQDALRDPDNISKMFGKGLLLFWVTILIALLSGVVGVINNIVVCRGTFQADRGLRHMVFGKLVRDSLPYFWPLVGLQFLVSLILSAILIPIVCACYFIFFTTMISSLDATGSLMTGGIVMLVVFYLVLLVISVLFGIVLQLCSQVLLIENTSITDALGRGWEIAKKNMLSCLGIALLLTLLNAGISILCTRIVYPFLFRLLPGFPGADSAAASNPLTIGLVVVLVLVVVFIETILAVYYQSAWTLTYLRLTRPAPRGKQAA